MLIFFCFKFGVRGIASLWLNFEVKSFQFAFVLAEIKELDTSYCMEVKLTIVWYFFFSLLPLFVRFLSPLCSALLENSQRHLCWILREVGTIIMSHRCFVFVILKWVPHCFSFCLKVDDRVSLGWFHYSYLPTSSQLQPGTPRKGLLRLGGECYLWEIIFICIVKLKQTLLMKGHTLDDYLFLLALCSCVFWWSGRTKVRIRHFLLQILK